jgi:transposase
MISREDFVKIKAMAAAGMFKKDIARELDIDARTVRRALVRGDAPKREVKKRVSKIEPYVGQIDELMKRGVWNGAVILREIEAAGYTGGRTTLRKYMQPKRALRMADRLTVRFETKEGQQLQSDWGQKWVKIGGIEHEAHFIVNTLGYSRRFHFWCTDSEDAEHTYEGLIRSFEYFGGVAEQVLLDNQKAAVFKTRGAKGEPAQFQERFVDLAMLYGFEPKACKPYRARTKGKDERMVGYIKHNFFERYQEFDSYAHMNQLAEQWLREEADPRVQGTVKEVVSLRFEREKGALKPLPAMRYDTAYHERRMAGWDGYIEVRGNRYSVPTELSGNSVRIRIGLDGILDIYGLDQTTRVAQHRLTQTRGECITVAQHHSDLWAKTLGVTMGVERRDLRVYQEVLE